ncbi:MAG: type secretion system protein TrbB [Aliidongia sp.]|jgi:type IV secretion system protein VirB11|nr:type secretion system protein TrbB [Aliidongia sp.]
MSRATHPESRERRRAMLRTALGPIIAGWLDEPRVVDVLLNPDGSLWVERLGEPRRPTGETLSPADAERIIRLVADHVGAEAHAGAPIVSAELPETGERFECLLPPVATAPMFAIRRQAAPELVLADYVTAGVLMAAEADFLDRAMHERLNVVIAGDAKTGKTTLARTLLRIAADLGDRLVLLEDRREILLPHGNVVALLAKDGVASLSDLVRSALRLSPDRIPVGEVRGREAIDLLDAWSTGHAGGVATIHAKSPVGALYRFEQLCLRTIANPPRELIAETVDVVVLIKYRDGKRRIDQIVEVTGLDERGGYRPTPVRLDSPRPKSEE